MNVDALSKTLVGLAQMMMTLVKNSRILEIYKLTHLGRGEILSIQTNKQTNGLEKGKGAFTTS
jgi:hypothetical protein